MRKGAVMSCHQLIGANWERRGKPTDADVEVIAEKCNIFFDKLKEKHSIAHEVAEKDLKAQEASLE